MNTATIIKKFDAGFCFAVDLVGKEWFGHVNEFAGHWDNLHIGDNITFIPGTNHKGECMTNMTLVL